MGQGTSTGGVIHVACCFDAHMEIPFLIVADSIRRHVAGDRKVLLHAFHVDPITHDPAISRALASDTFELRFEPIQHFFAGTTSQKHVTPAATCRLLLPELLSDVDRLIYLDTDVIVLRDLGDLYDIDLTNCALGAVVDHSLVGLFPLKGWHLETEAKSWLVEDYLRDVVGLSDWSAYFNSGVLVMDLERFRANGLAQIARAFMERTRSTRFFIDQDALNHVVDGAFARLDARWNVHAVRRIEDFCGADEHLSRVGSLWHSDPWILHYCGAGKPWDPQGEGTLWDARFWSEAIQGPVFPLIANHYLERCKAIQLASLCPPKRLFAIGKPKLEVRDVLAHAAQFAHVPASASLSESIAEELTDDAHTWLGSVFVDASQFQVRGGVAGQGAYTFDLAVADGHIVYGPYAWYPAGSYRATFDVSISDMRPGQGAICIEVGADRDTFLAQGTVPLTSNLTERDFTLDFATKGEETFIEFRIHAAGFKRGRLQFAGVKLQLVE
jgi:lipopolysaccharide biosynthesis glycosyltransferase